ncbi:hypothetical protein [Methylovulum psychrotolerans]|uniref:Uncharacterized protein n=1 Tax=Methylovulum psychrotolerans TaxID=1704499 RepID=A0A1Z4C284_9GAMM|nr:hypothetical protein [Methylovulum psychrotolerans]ASF47642.1 hypothetical protein CEK71_17095 [Methylovulum psychrotolerans]
MSAKNTNHRPTILIGYGRFGLEILRQFLVSTATRGVLVWDTPEGAGIGERRLRDLALLWLPDPMEDEGVGGAVLGGNRAELMRDLHRQIESPPDNSKDIQAFIKNKAEGLLNAAQRARRQDNLPLGLDVMVLAHTHDRRTLGSLQLLLKDSVIEPLYKGIPQLHRDVGADAINFIQVIDFENYWEDSDSAQKIREHFMSYIDFWQRRREVNLPTFGRIYLVDKHTVNGVREESERIDEISLFLEFLIFEGQRDSEALQTLYQARPDDGRLLATFGIRLLERSGGLLKRLSAARFGIGWLDYLNSAHPRFPGDIKPLREALKACCLDPVQDDALNGDFLLAECQPQLSLLMKGLESLSTDNADWPQQVQNRCEQGLRKLQGDLAGQAQSHIQQTLAHSSFADAASSLAGQVEAVLHNDRQPTTLGVVLHELEMALGTLKPTLGNTDEARILSTPNKVDFSKLRKTHAHYRRFLAMQLDIQGILKWWPLFALLFGFGLSPWLAGWLEAWLHLSVFDAATASPAMRFVHDAAQWLSGYESSGFPGKYYWRVTVVCVMMGIPIAYFLHRGVRREVLQARRFWTDVEHGRLVDALRALLNTVADIQATSAKQMQADAAISIRREASRELALLYEHLKERRREISWLRGQLHDFLDMYGLDAESSTENWVRLGNNSGIRHAIEQYVDLQRIDQTNPAIPERFQSMQAEKKPFKQWGERYSYAFLYPLQFIDDLSRAYQEPLEQELAKLGSGDEQTTRARELCAFLNRHSGDFSTAFRWRMRDGVPVDNVYCLLPSLWLSLPAVRATLTDQGVNEDHCIVGADGSRAYLLRLQIGVESSCLN